MEHKTVNLKRRITVFKALVICKVVHLLITKFHNTIYLLYKITEKLYLAKQRGKK